MGGGGKARESWWEGLTCLCLPSGGPNAANKPIKTVAGPSGSRRAPESGSMSCDGPGPPASDPAPMGLFKPVMKSESPECRKAGAGCAPPGASRRGWLVCLSAPCGAPCRPLRGDGCLGHPAALARDLGSSGCCSTIETRRRSPSAAFRVHHPPGLPKLPAASLTLSRKGFL